MDKFKAVDDFFEKGLNDDIYTGASLSFIKNNELLFSGHYGHSGCIKDFKIDDGSFFDLASLTKSLATTILFQILWQRGFISPEDRVSKYCDGFKNGLKNQIKIENLLLHDSGLPAHRHFYKILEDKSNEKREKLRLGFIEKEELEFKPGSKTLYSDLGFMVLKYILEKISNESMADFLKREVYDKISSNLFFPVKSDNKKYCSTSFSDFRKRRLTGEVNDENAYAVGGVDGHAGLFGTCDGISKVIKEINISYTNDDSKILKGEFTKKILYKRKEKRLLGFDIPSGENSSAGRFFSDHTAGHLGYTGTSFWMDIKKNISIILLTNRVYYGDNNFKIRFFRPQMHDLLISLM